MSLQSPTIIPRIAALLYLRLPPGENLITGGN